MRDSSNFTLIQTEEKRLEEARLVSDYLTILTDNLDLDDEGQLEQLLYKSSHKLNTLYDYCKEVFIHRYIEKIRFTKLKQLLQNENVHVFTLNTDEDGVKNLFETVFEIPDMERRIHFTRNIYNADPGIGVNLFIEDFMLDTTLQDIGKENLREHKLFKAFKIREFFKDNFGIAIDDDNEILNLVAGTHANTTFLKALQGALQEIHITFVPTQRTKTEHVQNSEEGVTVAQIDTILKALQRSEELSVQDPKKKLLVAIDFDGTIIQNVDTRMRMGFTDLLRQIAELKDD
jgi:AraC-like DNA-binding protein